MNLIHFDIGVIMAPFLQFPQAPEGVHLPGRGKLPNDDPIFLRLVGEGQAPHLVFFCHSTFQHLCA
jgi:hypothetical protein